MRRMLLGCLLIGWLLLPGCAWVSVTDAGDDVRVFSSYEVSDCERLGNTKASVLPKVWFVPRPKGAVEKELTTLARNEGAGMGGNVVTPLPSPAPGEREFAVYVCGD